MPTLDHVALAVRDPLRSLRFYRDVLGVEGRIREEEFGFVLTTTAGVTFTLFRGEPPSTMGDFHVGVSLDDAAAVREARVQLRSLGLTEKEWCEEDGYVSVKILDPDGYVVEVSWDADQEVRAPAHGRLGPASPAGSPRSSGDARRSE